MTNYQKFGLVAGQVFMGLGFAIPGGIAGLIVDYIISVTSGMYSDLFGEIMNALIGCYIGLFFGIAFDGYKFLKTNGRQNEFFKFFFQSLVGLTAGLLGLYFIVMNKKASDLPEAVVNSLAIVLPLTGTILGFNFSLNKTKQGT